MELNEENRALGYSAMCDNFSTVLHEETLVDLLTKCVVNSYHDERDDCVVSAKWIVRKPVNIKYCCPCRRSSVVPRYAQGIHNIKALLRL